MPQIAPAADAATPSAEAASSAVPPALDSAGEPLDHATRAYFEPRFGRNFSDVRVHTGRAAASSARALGARAYTVGRDIAFESGEYAPRSEAGRRLIGHELAHVVQQRAAGRPMLQRMVRGSGTPPTGWTRPGGGTFTLAIVPADEVERVDAAIAMVQEVVNDPSGYSSCHEYFQDHCPGAAPNVLTQVFNNAVVWKLTDPTGNENARGDVNGPNIAYTDGGYGQGTRGLAGTLMHELLHNCGNTGGDEHWHAAAAAAYCIRKESNQMGVRFAFSDETFMMMLTYRRILAELAQGHIRFTTGGDLNIVGTTLEITPLAGAEDTGMPYEITSGMVGAEARTGFGGALGGERYGGIYGRVDTGFGIGRFALIPAPPGEEREAETGIYGSYVLQLTGGVEFLIPANPSVFPLRIEAGYRLAEPLTDEAERIDTFTMALEFPW